MYFCAGRGMYANRNAGARDTTAPHTHDRGSEHHEIHEIGKNRALTQLALRVCAALHRPRIPCTRRLERRAFDACVGRWGDWPLTPQRGPLSTGRLRECPGPASPSVKTVHAQAVASLHLCAGLVAQDHEEGSRTAAGKDGEEEEDRLLALLQVEPPVVEVGDER